jgi:hypothetical protein
MTKYEIVPATFEHGIYLVNRLRQADIDEMWAAHHVTPRQGVLISLAVSRDTSYTGLVDGKPICIYGVAQPSLMVDAGRPWMLGTDEIPKHSLKFLRENRKVVKEMQAQFPILFNYVDARHTDAIRWLAWLGFKLEAAAPYGPDRLPFHRFSMGEENV